MIGLLSVTTALWTCWQFNPPVSRGGSERLKWLDAYIRTMSDTAGNPLSPDRPDAERPFRVDAPFDPAGDQPKAIEQLADGFREGMEKQTLLGVTGSGKTNTVSWVIEEIQKPTLVIAHNKTLAAQLYEEFRSLFPDNAVEYFVSYYDIQ